MNVAGAESEPPSLPPEEDPARRAPKGHTRGTHRLVSPRDTWLRVAPMMRAMGITRVCNITGLDDIGVPVVAVTRPNSRSISVAQGKGLDLDAAKVSGLMESVENYHAENIRLPLVLASWRQILERGPAIDFRTLPRVEGGTFHPDDRLLWVEGREVFARHAVWLPFEVVHTDYTVPLPTGSGAFLMSDSGVASGNHPLEATSHGICELVERDAVTLWRFQSPEAQAATRLDLDSVSDEACRSVLERIARAGVRVAAWEVTSDIGIPAFYATIVDPEPDAWRLLGPASGSGCHPCREIALLRALTEAVQARLTVIAGGRDDISVATYRDGQDAEVRAQALALMNASSPCRPFAEGPTFQGATMHDDVGWELQRLSAAGLEEVAVVDLTLPEFGIPVVRVVIPGLESMCEAAGFTAGRRLRKRLA